MSQLRNPKGIEVSWRTDTSNATVALSEITIALPRHSFPAIDFPPYLGQNEGLERFYIQEPVIAVEHNGDARAFSLSMLTTHEIVNEEIGGIPLLITYCPLCNASVVYHRRVTHGEISQTLDFEVSGMLRNSDMVMADQQMENWWQQFTGECIVGSWAGTKLDIMPSQVMSVEDFFQRWPQGRIMSPDAHVPSQKEYGRNPYVGYDASEAKPYERYFDYDSLDSRLQPMERVVDVEGPQGYKVYPWSAISLKGVLHDSFDGMDLVLLHGGGMVSVLDKAEISESRITGSVGVFLAHVDGRKLTFKKKRTCFFDEQTESQWDLTGRCIQGELKGKQLPPVTHSNHFAFAWFAFHPDSEVYNRP